MHHMAIGPGARIFAIEGPGYNRQFYIGRRRTRVCLLTEGLYFLDEPSVVWRIQHGVIKQRGGGVHAIFARDLSQLFKRWKSSKLCLRDCQRMVHAVRFRLPKRKPTMSPITKHPAP